MVEYAVEPLEANSPEEEIIERIGGGSNLARFVGRTQFEQRHRLTLPREPSASRDPLVSPNCQTACASGIAPLRTQEVFRRHSGSPWAPSVRARLRPDRRHLQRRRSRRLRVAGSWG